MNNMVYLDNSSTTKVCARAVLNINNALNINFGNPSSLHIMGMNAENELNMTRDAVSRILSCKSDEIFFTSGGTEANNTAIFGAAYSRRKRGNRIVTTTIEHPSVLECMKKLESEGFEVIRLSPDSSGKISEEKIKSAINDKTILVSIMLVNNETGAIQPIAHARSAVNACGAPAIIHCDAVQGFGKLKISPNLLGVDLLTASGHKIHGPKGVGILYKKQGVHITPIIYGGGQEKGVRSGTESVPLISGLRGAIEELPPVETALQKMAELRDYAIEKLNDLVEINSPPDALPYILNVSLDGYRSETVLHFLEARDIFVSSGSACAKGHGSYVLLEQGLPKNRVDSAIRISFSKENTKKDIDMLFEALFAAKAVLRSSK